MNECKHECQVKSHRFTGNPIKTCKEGVDFSRENKALDAVETGKSHRSVASEFNVGHTQIKHIICNKDSIKSLYTEGMNASCKYLAPHNMLYPEIDQDVWEFFCLARSKLIPVNGPMLQSKANYVVALSNTYRDDISDGYSIPDEKPTIGYSIRDEIPTTCFQLCELV